MNYDDRSTSAGRFYGIAEALCWAVGKAIRPGFISAVLAMIVVRRIQRVRGALMALEARFLAGRVRRVVRRVTAQDAPAVTRVRVVPVDWAEWVPRRLGWLFPLVPSDAVCYAGHFRVILAEPGMQALLAACPQAVRVLRPLCVMLGIERAAYVPEGAEPVVRRVRVRAPRAAKPERWKRDLAAEDAHYASSGVPRRYRLRIPVR